MAQFADVATIERHPRLLHAGFGLDPLQIDAIRSFLAN
jgi:hypothetical protein